MAEEKKIDRCHPTVISWIRLTTIRRKVRQAFDVAGEMMPLKRLIEIINQENVDNFSQEDIDAALISMADANQIFISDGIVCLV